MGRPLIRASSTKKNQGRIRPNSLPDINRHCCTVEIVLWAGELQVLKLIFFLDLKAYEIMELAILPSFPEHAYILDAARCFC